VGIQNSTVLGNVALAQGNGGAVAMSASGDAAAFSALVVGGNFSVTQGDGASDLVGIVGLNGPNTIGGNFSITQGDGNSDKIDIEDTAVGGNTSLKLGDGSNDRVDIEATVSGDSGVTFNEKVTIRFGDGGGATLNVGTDGDPVSFGADADFSAGGTGNTYNQGPNVSFQPGQPTLHNI
jgi:hypothetical protein